MAGAISCRNDLQAERSGAAVKAEPASRPNYTLVVAATTVRGNQLFRRYKHTERVIALSNGANPHPQTQLFFNIENEMHHNIIPQCSACQMIRCTVNCKMTGSMATVHLGD